jgi:hypothetical protein
MRTKPIEKYDRATIRELARCFARAAVDEMLAEIAKRADAKPKNKKAKS